MENMPESELVFAKRPDMPSFSSPSNPPIELKIQDATVMVGRRNWLFSGSPKGAEASAAVYSIIENAKANGKIPYEYLRYILISARSGFWTIPGISGGFSSMESCCSGIL